MDKVEEIESLISQNKHPKSADIPKLLKTISPTARKVIASAISSGYLSDTKRNTSLFGYRIHQIYQEKRFHHGIDFGGEIAIPIRAMADGIVEFA